MAMRKMKSLQSYRLNAEFLYKVGVKYANKRIYSTALRFLNRAIEIEPFNADYNFNLACILTELKDIKKSNEVLLGILKNMDPTLAECYFGIGCNYFDMGELEKAKEYFEKYVYIDPEGQFSDETYEILYHLQLYEYQYENPDASKNKRVKRLANEAKRLLDKEDYSKACVKLEKIIEDDPLVISARNNLAIAYFFSQQVDKAISIAKSVLKLQPENVFANCNLALFYTSTGKYDMYHSQVKVLNDLKITDRADFTKILDTYIALGEHDYIIKVILDYLRENKESFLYQLVPIAFYNLKHHDDAELIWKELSKTLPQYSIVSEYYRNVNRDTKNEAIQHSNLNYTVKIPEHLIKKYSNIFDGGMLLDTEDFKNEWAKNGELRNTFFYFLYESDKETKRSVIDKLMASGILKAGNSKARRVLKNMMAEANIQVDVKALVMDALGIKN